MTFFTGNTRNKSGDFLEDRIGRSRPDEGATGTIVALYEGVDFLDQVVDTGGTSSGDWHVGLLARTSVPPG